MNAVPTLSGIRIEGNLLAPDMTAEVLAGDLKGQTAPDFGFKKSDKLEDEIAVVWGDAKLYWAAFQRRLARLPETDPATSLTREFWAVPLLELLGYQPTYQARAEVVDGQTYAISHRAEPIAASGTDRPPIHIVGCRVGLEQRPPSGTPRLSAHALVQEYLNRTEHLWAIATNGLCWRLLRDSSLMTRLTYVEFDLEQILNGENFAEFGVFYRLFHRSRLPQGTEDADACLLEFYHQEALQQGGRVRERLRDGVEQALVQLGTGFLQHPKNERLRSHLDPRTAAQRDTDGVAPGTAKGEVPLDAAAYYRQLLLLIYRLLFLMVAEARQLLLAEGNPDAAHSQEDNARLYRDYYSIERLRALAERPSYRREGFQDLWQGLRVTFALFDDQWRGKLLGLSPLNGDLFGAGTLKALDDCAIDNYDLMRAVRALSLYQNKGQVRRVNYGALDVEELGSVYESLLDFTPQVVQREGMYAFVLVRGSDRKTTGSYYTPPELVAQLIRSALEPVLEARLQQAAQEGDPETALLALKICDPACGSGHFLLAAARRVGKELARVRTGEAQSGPEPLRQAIRDVIQHCIYGVDLNPLAVDLCKVALWIEGFCRGLPLNFLDHRIRCGNSLVGVLDLSCLDEGIPDAAYKAVTGDDKKLSSQLKKRNKQERDRQGQLSLFDELEPDRATYSAEWRELGNRPETTTADIKQKQARYQRDRSPDNRGWWRDFAACNLWTAAFFMPLTEHQLQLLPTTEALHRWLREPEDKGNRIGVGAIVAAANRLADEKRFFHWCLEFPEVFEQGGFDCVLGNPPWERIKLQEKEFFAARDAAIANAQNKAARERLIKQLPRQNPQLALAWETEKHDAEAQSKFLRESGRFPLTAVGDINTYAVFAETVRMSITSQGRAGIIIPTGIATDATYQKFFGAVAQNQNLASLYDFENRENIFPGVGHGRYKFSLFSLCGHSIKHSEFSFFLTNPKQVGDPARVFQMSPQDIALMNPNTLTCPVFRTRDDAELTKKIYQRVPILENEQTGKNPWGISFMAMFHMSGDSGLFKHEPEEGLLPLYEAKMFWHYNHRNGDYADYPEGAQTSHLPDIPEERLQNPNYTITPRYWVSRAEVENRLGDRWNRKWLLAFRDVTNATNERTGIFSFLPRVAVGHKAPLIFISQANFVLYCLFTANLNSVILDFVLRQKIGGTSLSFFILKQLPVIPPDAYSSQDIDFIAPRVLELTYTAWDMKPFAEDMGYHGDPFIWNEQRRALLRAELDAYYAHLYGLTRDELRYILDPADVYGSDFPSETFRVLKNNEIKKYGEYRTQRLVLAAWDMLGF